VTQRLDEKEKAMSTRQPSVTQRAEWIGSNMSLFMEQANGAKPVIVKNPVKTKQDGAGYAHGKATVEPFEPPAYWQTDLLPEPLRHRSGHWNSHCFLTHEFADAIANDRQPVNNLYEALAPCFSGYCT
jgi:hypothetical protein